MQLSGSLVLTSPQSVVHPLPVFQHCFEPLEFQCTTAASTLCALDGYGLRHLALARPPLTPLMRFLFIGSHLCATLPPDLASRQMPLRFAILHLHQVECGTCTRTVVDHARHTL